MTRKRFRLRPPGGLPVVFLTGAFLFRGVFLGLALPGGDPLDETFHFAYSAFLAETSRVPGSREPSIPAEFQRPAALLPASTRFAGPRVSWKEFSALPEDRRRELRREAYEERRDERSSFFGSNYETQQPPVFYAVAAATLKLQPRARFSTRLLVLRLLAAALAALAVPHVYAFFRRLLARRAAVAATAAFVAFPGVGSFVGRFTNDALALPVAAALLGLFADAARGRLTRARSVLLAVLLAAGCWTKLYFLLLVPVAPLAALLTARGRRTGAWRRAALASAAALLSILPWLARQKSDTGDWSGLWSSSLATALGIHWADRLRALPEIFNWRFAIIFSRTFLWPGTWSASGAPAALAICLIAVLSSLFLVPNLLGGFPCRARAVAWRAGGLAVVLFLLGQCGQAAVYAAIGKLRGHPPSAGPDGWYLLLLLPVILSAGCFLGREIPRALLLAAAVIFLLAEGWLTFGVLSGVYGGRTVFNGANAPFGAYGTYLLRPTEVLEVFARVGLAGVPASALALVAGLWLALLGCAAFVPSPGAPRWRGKARWT